MEMILCFFAEILGVMLFGTLSGMLSRMAFTQDAAEVEFQRQMVRNSLALGGTPRPCPTVTLDLHQS